MARFSAVVAGTRARNPVTLPLPGAHVDEDGAWVGPTVKVDVRALRDDEYADMLAAARAFAKKRGLESPEDGDELYERGKMLHTLALAFIDAESPPDNPQPFFDGGWEQIHKSDAMTPEIVGHLYQQQQIWQDDVNPLKRDLTPAEFYAATVKTAGGDMSFFVGSRQGTLWTYLRTLASQHLVLLGRSSSSTSSSAEPTTTGN